VLATLAHELKTPLSAIAAASEIMRDERLGAIGDERYRGYAADIHAGARHALAVVERLLAGRAPATTLPAGTPPDADSARRLTDLNEVAAECVSVLKPLADNARLELTAVLSRDPVRLAADATSLRQILINLLTNAIKFARRGDAVEVATRRDEAGAVSVEVRDTGPGMTRAEIARALDAGAEPLAAPRRGGGLGIGLPLVRQLAEANGGRLAIESVPGKGTRVQIEFGRGA
jgi:signal transduction histidine kinase